MQILVRVFISTTEPPPNLLPGGHFHLNTYSKLISGTDLVVVRERCLKQRQSFPGRFTGEQRCLTNIRHGAQTILAYRAFWT